MKLFKNSPRNEQLRILTIKFQIQNCEAVERSGRELRCMI